MVLARPPDRPADASAVREVAEAELQDVRRSGMAGEPWAAADPSSVDELLAVQHLHDRCVRVRRFAAYADGRVGSYCDLYVEDGIAQVESVMTVPELRNRGLARAVVTRAVEAAREDGAGLVFLVALEDDWPRELYRKLGFDVTGRRVWAQLTPQRRLDLALDGLLRATGASRVTLRRPAAGEFFPVTNEALSAGAKSIADGAGIDLRGQPVVARLATTRAQVVQHDCASAFDDPAFHAMREAYGGLASQIVTPIHDGEELIAIVSLHQCGEPRTWTEAEIALAAATADRVKEIVSPRAQPLAPGHRSELASPPGRGDHARDPRRPRRPAPSGAGHDGVGSDRPRTPHPLTGTDRGRGSGAGRHARGRAPCLRDGRRLGVTCIVPGLRLPRRRLRGALRRHLVDRGRQGALAGAPGRRSAAGDPFAGAIGVAPSHELMRQQRRREDELRARGGAVADEQRDGGGIPASAAKGCGRSRPARPAGTSTCASSSPEAVVFLQVQVPGALFSVGDLHFAQGDGEACGVAVEVAGAVTVRFGLEQGAELAAALPRVRDARPARSGKSRLHGWPSHRPQTAATNRSISTLATRNAMLEMVGYLVASAGTHRARRPTSSSASPATCGSPRSSTYPTRPSRACSRSISSSRDGEDPRHPSSIVARLHARAAARRRSTRSSSSVSGSSALLQRLEPIVRDAEAWRVDEVGARPHGCPRRSETSSARSASASRASRRRMRLPASRRRSRSSRRRSRTPVAGSGRSSVYAKALDATED